MNFSYYDEDDERRGRSRGGWGFDMWDIMDDIRNDKNKDKSKSSQANRDDIEKLRFFHDRQAGDDKQLGISHRFTWDITAVESFTNGSQFPLQQRDLQSISAYYQGPHGMEYYLQNVLGPLARVGKVYQLSSHPFEEHKVSKKENINLTGNPHDFRESLGTFTDAVVRRHLPSINNTPLEVSRRFGGHIYLLLTEGKKDGELYYGFNYGSEKPELFAAGGNNYTKEGDTVRRHFNALFALIHDRIEMGFVLTTINAKYARMYQNLLHARYHQAGK